MLAILLTTSAARAQDYGEDPAAAVGAYYAQASAPASFSQEELDQMLAPIALYPDSLLTQILMASTYPLEVVEAARWSRANPGLAGDQAVSSAEQFDWDPSVKSLTAFPQILLTMDLQLDWTRQLGDAFLAQPNQVMDTVQNLRRRAFDAGNLRTTEQMQVQAVGPTIDVAFANPQIIYVPYYDPTLVYGAWWWPAYPPVYWPPWPGYALAYTQGFYWGPAISVPIGFFFGEIDWHRHRVETVGSSYYDVHFARHRADGPPPGGTASWRHDPAHRLNVPYRNPAVRRRFGRAGASTESRQQYRGYQAPPTAVGVIPNSRGGNREPVAPLAPPPVPQRAPERQSIAPLAPPPISRRVPERQPVAPLAPPPVRWRAPERQPAAPLAPRQVTRPVPEQRPSAFETVPQGHQAREFSARGRASTERPAPSRAPLMRAPTNAPAPRTAAPTQGSRSGPTGRGRR